MNDNDSTEEIEELLEDSLEEDLDEAVEDGEEDIEDSDDLEDEDDFSGDEEDEADEDLEDDEEIEDDEEDSEEEEPAEEDKPIKAASDGEFNAKDYFAASQIPGTPEYDDALEAAATKYAETRIKEKFGDDELDMYDPRHAVIFQQACNRIDKVATNAFEEKTQQLKEQRATQLSFKKAEEKIDSILPTPELVEKFENTIGDMKTRDFKKLQDAAAKGDFSGFIEIAERVSQASEKVRRVKNRNQPAPKPKQGKKSKAKRKVIRRERDVDIEYGGVSDMLGL